MGNSIPAPYTLIQTGKPQWVRLRVGRRIGGIETTIASA